MAKKIIKNFEIFEANLRDNKGLNRAYVDDIKRGEERDAHQRIRSGEVQPNRIMSMAIELNRLHGGQIQMTPQGPIPTWIDRDKKSIIEELANDIINDQYGRIIDALNIDLDIKLVDFDEMQDMKGEMEENEEESELKPNIEDVESDDEDLKMDVDKRKLVNNITQGSAKNTHRLIHLYKEKIDEVDPQIFDLMDRLIKSNETMEWTLPEREGQGKMIIQMMNGYSKVEFEDEEDEEEVKDEMEEIDIEKLLNNEEEEVKEFEEEFEDFSGKVKVTARGIDLVILLHEAVKGIYEVLGSPSLPEATPGDLSAEEKAKQIMYNTDTADDEFEDLRYGPRIRQDLLNWVNSNEKIHELEDSFEYVWGAMVSMQSRDFLKLFFDAIIGKTGDADKWLDETLDNLISDQERYRQEMSQYDQDQRDDESGDSWKQGTEYEQDEDSKKDNSSELEQRPSPTQQKQDFSKMSVRDLERAMDDALDSGDMESVQKIGDELSKR